MPSDRPPPGVSAASPASGLDVASAEWVRALTAPGPDRDAAIERLFGVLLLAARTEVRRRSGQLRISGPEAEDLAHQAAGDALMAVCEKVGGFRGQSRFTTWAYKFVILEVSAKVGRHFWRNPGAELGERDWERLPDRMGLAPPEASEWRELIAALSDAIATALTERQREVFTAVVLEEVPVDALAARLGSTRNAVYKTLFDARRNLRLHLERGGHLPPRGRDGT